MLPTLDFDFHLLGPTSSHQDRHIQNGQVLWGKISLRISYPSKCSVALAIPAALVGFKMFYAVLSTFLLLAGHVTIPGNWRPWSLFSVSSMGDTPWKQHRRGRWDRNPPGWSKDQALLGDLEVRLQLFLRLVASSWQPPTLPMSSISLASAAFFLAPLSLP